MSLFAFSELIISEFRHSKVEINFTFLKKFFNLGIIWAINQTFETGLFVRERNKGVLGFNSGNRGFSKNTGNNLSLILEGFLELLKCNSIF
jgi:hypothetical protein